MGLGGLFRDPHFNLSQNILPQRCFEGTLVCTQSSPFHLGRGAESPPLCPQVRASLQRAAFLVRHGLNEVGPWARGHSWRERAPGPVSTIPVNPAPPGCPVHKVLRSSGMTPRRDNLKTRVQPAQFPETLMPVSSGLSFPTAAQALLCYVALPPGFSTFGI